MKIKVGDRVTTLGNRHLPNGWGTVIRIIDVALPHLKPPKSQRWLAEVLWDGRDKSSIVMLTYLFKDGESPINLSHSNETLVDPKRASKTDGAKLRRNTK
jgi:hypothetical protein